MTRWEEVDQAIGAVRREWPVPGLAIGIVDAHDLVFESSAGFADIAAGREVGPSSRFEIGSISKSFTGAVFAQLAEEGLVDLAAPVTAYLPWFTVNTGFAPITVRHLLHHTSGLIAGGDTLPDAIAQVRALRDTETGTAPGQLFHYSNVGYAALGLIIEVVTNSSLAEVITARLLQRLGMHRSSSRITNSEHSALAIGYQALHSDRLLLSGDELIPATWTETAVADGNVTSTAPDLARFARMLLGRGRLDAAEVLTPVAFSRFTGDLAPGGEPSPHVSRYALGINTERVDGHLCLTHGGGMVGYASFLAVDLDAQIGVVALSNAPGECTAVEELARRTLDFARTGDASSLRAIPGRNSIPDPDMLVGKYSDGVTSIDVRRATGGGLELTDEAGTGRLYATGQERLGCDHGSWRTFPHRSLEIDGTRAWVSGPYVLPSVSAFRQEKGPPKVTQTSPLVGHWRSYTPWYPSFRIVARADRLYLVASAGVEAHTDEPELIDLGGGRYRIGADARLPERLICGPVIDSVAVWIDRDGCRYSRSFRD